MGWGWGHFRSAQVAQVGPVQDVISRVLLARLYDSFATGDPSAWTDNLAEDAVGVGTDPEEWWDGREMLAKVVTAQLEQMHAAGIRVERGSPLYFEKAEVVWVLDQPTISTPDGTSTPARLTLIATHKGDGLEINHFHVSVGAPNVEVIGEDLPTA